MLEQKIVTGGEIALYDEIGRIGQNRWGGSFYEEFLPELRGQRGVKVYTEMESNDDVIGAIIFALDTLLRQAQFSVEPQGDDQKDIEAAEFVESCMDDMQSTWTDTVSEILSFLTYGWSYHEIVYKRRSGRTGSPKTNSKYDDGLIGWRKLPIRSQDSLYQWEYDDEDNLIGMTQMPPPNFGLYTIPLEKAIHFRTRSRKGNPEGRSILRNAYRSWYFKKGIQEFEGIGIERDLAGIPMVTPPEGVDLYNPDDPEGARLLAWAYSLVKNVRQDKSAGIVLPPGFKFELVSTGGSRQIDTNEIITRYDSRIAMTTLADFILLGHEHTGSFALSDDKTELFAVAIGSYLDIICEAFNNQAIPRLIDLNGEHFKGITDYPKMVHGDIEKIDMNKLAQYIQAMVGTGVLIPDDELETYVREAGNLPPKVSEDERFIDPDREDQQTNDLGSQGNNVHPEDNQDVAEDVGKVQEAKKRLGRS